MDTNSLFTFVGMLFAIAAIFYFTGEYLFKFSRDVKLVVLICLTLLFFSAAEILRRRKL